MPLNPNVIVSAVVPEKCKFMDSKKLPLWISLVNHEEEDARELVIFKAGDDLRQVLSPLQF